MPRMAKAKPKSTAQRLVTRRQNIGSSCHRPDKTLKSGPVRVWFDNRAKRPVVPGTVETAPGLRKKRP